jgi:hypothetical protein
MSSGNSGQFGAVEEENGVANLQNKIIGPDYDYSAKIKSPAQMSMSSKGTWGQLGKNINGLIGYIDLMVSGSCKSGKCASTTGGPLGARFFVDTPVKCTDKKTREKVKRSLYINNVPDGSIPFLSNMSNVYFNDFKGLLPGLMSNAAQLNPMQILLSFVSGTGSTCQEITMQTIDSNDNRGIETAYVLNKDIELMNPAWFNLPGHPKPNREQLKELEPEEESFTLMDSNSSLKESKTLNGSNIDYSKMPDDILIKFYYSSLGLLCLYFLFKILMKTNKK